MQVDVVPLTDFQHGRVSFREGVSPPGGIPESLALDLERAGLVRVKMSVSPPHAPVAPPRRTQEAPVHRTQEAPPVSTPTPPDPLGKSTADGEGTPSALLPAAQVSPSMTVAPLKRGRGRPRKNAT